MKKYIATAMGFLGGRRLREGEVVEIETTLENPASWLKPYVEPKPQVAQIVLSAAERIALREREAAEARKAAESKGGSK